MFFIWIGFLLVQTPLTTSKKYRTDYIYNIKTDSFYNLHIESRDRWRADQICRSEGASLMYPGSDQDVVQFHALFKKYPDLGNYAWVQDDGKPHEEAHEKVFVLGEEETPEAPWERTCDVLTRDGDIQKYRCALGLPFICKVDAKDAYFDATCNVHSKSYQYFQDVGSCYKVSQIACTWNEAYAECQKEGAHLVVLNSEAEHQVVWNLTKRAPYVSDARAHFFFFAGFRANKAYGDQPRVFRTIFNQTLEDAGFAQWSENEPNNALNNEDCGSIFKNDGKLNDLDCAHKFAFICEKEKCIAVSWEMIVFCVLLALLSTSFTTKTYRTDYVYNRQTDAFYKIHIDGRGRRDAGNVCKAEGAKLMPPESDQDIIQVHSMLKKFPDLGDYVWVQEDGREHEAATEPKVVVMGEPDHEDPWTGDCDVVTRKGDIESRLCFYTLPFICKVKARDAYYDTVCDVYGKNYKYMESTGSCYRISDIAYTWNGAYDECQAEGAHLVVLNSETEHQVVWNLTQVAPTAAESRAHWFLFAGYRANHPTDEKPRVFRTIFNQTLEEAGYDQWSANEPNNALNNEYCGSIFKNDGKLNDLDCAHTYSFICEKERHIHT
ncbi:macrophage mannose receptor 1 [Plodia interpunctella]|uniref:macrophage mannose receptor 1 n=1 Tax=Plodia interpunctella TaxID=58824 RepID=UPI0023684CA2|nr:macrophage mannose receptor 1 [Plodia interpunctella]